MNKPIKKIAIYSNNINESLFNNIDKYIIPIYQRAYSWTDKEIIQLIEDINDYDYENGSEYFIGSLVVNKKNDTYEVIDGQQRLTTLYLIYKVLNLNTSDKSLSFQCRSKSDFTLKNYDAKNIDSSELDSGIMNGIDTIKSQINKKDFNTEEFIEKLKKVIIFRVEVPIGTNLNRYFEIMNTRGEQLEQTDILKAKLMSYLDNECDRNSFIKIWSACCDMTGYVQMHFSKNDRECLFGSEWDELVSEPFNHLEYIPEEKNGVTFNKIIDEKFVVDINDGLDENDDHVRFESIIDFPYFLQHVLKICVDTNDLENKNDPKRKLYSELMDDKKLINSFDYVIENAKDLDTKEFVKSYINCLLKCRWLFDKYIIKREYKLDDQIGTWKNSTLHVSKGKRNSLDKPYYSDTLFNRKYEQESTYKGRNKLNVMIQSCLRVSYISSKIMHWITYLLKELYCTKDYSDCADLYVKAEDYAKIRVNNDFLKGKNYKMGVDTPHVVFNYLDYLLWKNDKEKYKDFIFEFRNSVEHWYPQNPLGEIEKWDDVDRFGNLCIIQRNVNSKFSNMPPETKKESYSELVSKGSLKLRVMSSKTTSNSEHWKETYCPLHEEEMINLLSENCKNIVNENVEEELENIIEEKKEESEINNNGYKINSIEDFYKYYGHSIIVNYDIINDNIKGVAYRTKKNSLEHFRNDYNGKTIEYPNIQQYQKGLDPKKKIYIIKDNRMFELKRIDEHDIKSDYEKVSEIIDVDPKCFNDKAFYNFARKSTCINEPILKIIE